MRSTIEVPIGYSEDEANSRMKYFFGTHGYVPVQNGAEILMRGGDKIMGVWYIAPNVMPGKVVLQGFIGRPGKSEKNLDGFVGALIKTQARNAMVELQQTLIDNQQYVSSYQNPGVEPQAAQASYIPAPGALAEKNANRAIGSIVVGGLGCLLPFIGFYMGVIGVLIGIWLGTTALKTSKRTLAIVGIVLNSVGAVLTVFMMLLTFVFERI